MKLIYIKQFSLKYFRQFIAILLIPTWLYLMYFAFSPLSDKELKEFVSESSCHYRNAKEELESDNNSISKIKTWNFIVICFQEKKDIEEKNLISKQIRILNEANKEKNLEYDFHRIPVF